MTDEPAPSLFNPSGKPICCPKCGLPLDEDHTPEVCADWTAWLAEHRRRFAALDWS